MKFRNARIEDQKVLNQISLNSKRHWGYPEEWIQNWIEDLQLSESDFDRLKIVVGIIEDTIIGFCAISDEKTNYEILHLWLLPEFIGQGYGKKLLHLTISKFILAPKPILVTADPNAEAFYRKQGFEPFKKIESYPKGRFLTIMRKKPNRII